MCTDAGKEVARSKKVMDNNGKEYTLFLAPKPIKGKPLDTTKMFDGQLQHLFKQVETSSKCGKHIVADKKKSSEANITRFRRFKQDFRSRRAGQRGGRFERISTPNPEAEVKDSHSAGTMETVPSRGNYQPRSHSPGQGTSRGVYPNATCSPHSKEISSRISS